MSNDLFAVANLLESESTLRRALADSGIPATQRTNLAAEVLQGQVSVDVAKQISDLVAKRWSHDADLVAAIEQAGAQAELSAAESAGVLDTVEEEIFQFARLVDRDAQLQMALTDPAQSTAAKAMLITDLLSGRVNAASIVLIAQYVSHLRGRRLGAALDELSALAAQRRGRIVASVTSAIALDDGQKERIKNALGRIYGREVQLDCAVDTSVIGGVAVLVGDDLIDGTIASKLGQARRALLG